jgi:hypothetical protein
MTTINLMSRASIAAELGTSWRRVDQAIRFEGMQPFNYGGHAYYGLDQVREAYRRMEASDAKTQREATLAVSSLRVRAGDDALVRWYEGVMVPLLRTVKVIRHYK